MTEKDSKNLEEIKSLLQEMNGMMGTYMQAKISPNQKVILNIGAGAAIEKDQESAINWIESRIKEFEIALQETSAQKQQVITSLESGKQQMNQLMQQAGQKPK